MAAPDDEIPLKRIDTYPRAKSQRKISCTATFHAKWVQDWWLVELLSASIGIVAIVALDILLNHYRNREAPLGNTVFSVNITLNTLISILSTISKAALLLPVSACISQLKWQWYHRSHRPLDDIDTFDKASRGPWVSLQLSWKISLRYV